jgi:hypothetical protein
MRTQDQIAEEARQAAIAYKELVEPLVLAMIMGKLDVPMSVDVVHRIQWDGNYRTFTVGVEVFGDEPYDLGGVEEAIRQIRYGHLGAKDQVVVHAYIDEYMGRIVQSVGICNAMTLAYIILNHHSTLDIKRNRDTGELFYVIPFDYVKLIAEEHRSFRYAGHGYKVYGAWCMLTAPMTVPPVDAREVRTFGPPIPGF